MTARKPVVFTNGTFQQVQPGDNVDLTTLGAGTPNSSTFLRGDGQWTASAGVDVVRSISAATTLGSGAQLVEVSATAAYTITLPAASSMGGERVKFWRSDNSAYDVTIMPNGSETINGKSFFTLPANTQYGFAVLETDGTNWVVAGTNLDLALVRRETQTATAGQTAFTLNTISYTVGSKQLKVYQAGALLPLSEYTETNSTTVTLKSGATTGDVLDFIVEGQLVAGLVDSIVPVSTTTALNAGPQLVEVTATATYTITLPPPVRMVGEKISFWRGDNTAYTVTIAQNASDLIDGYAEVPLPATSQGAFYVMESDGTNWSIVSTNVMPTLFGGTTVNGNVTINGGGSFTADVTGVTAATSDNSTKFATTAWVKAQGYGAGGGGSSSDSITSVSTTTTLSSGAQLVKVTASAAYTITLPVASGMTGQKLSFWRADNTAFAVTITHNSTETINGATSLTLPASSQYAFIVLESDGTNWELIASNVNSQLFGNPTAVTPTNADNSTSIATTAFVKAQNYLTGNQSITLSGDASGSGATAIAVTLANSGVSAGTYQGLTVDAKGRVTAAVNQNYAPLASPAFTGTPTAPTVATADNSTSLATTAWVKAQGYAGGTSTADSVVNVSTTTTLSSGAQVAEVTATAAYTITLPTPSSMTGKKIVFWRGDNTAYAVTVTRSSTETINGVNSITLPASSQYAYYVLESDGTNWVIWSTNINSNLVGTPTAPTPATADSSTAIATSAFVKAQNYLTGNQTITLSGDATGSGSTAIAVTLANSGVSAGSYNNVTVNAKGLVTAASTVSYLTANQTITISGDVTGSGTTAITATLGNSGVTAGTYQGLTVDAKGRVTGATNQNYAPLASPALTGTPTAPTAAVGTNTTQLATTAFVLGQAASATPLIDGTAAVGTSATYARADHVHPTDTSRAPLASPAFTGTPTAATAAFGTSSTQLATTAFAAALADQVTNVSTTATLTATQHGLINVTATAAYTITLPAANATGMIGQRFVFYRSDNTAYAVTISRAGTDTIEGVTTLTIPAAAQYALIELESDGSSNWVIVSSNVNTTLLGSAHATTVSTADSSTNIATTAYVQNNLANYLTTSSATSTYAPLASPSLTGTPTAPTAALNTNSTQLATTAYVLGQASSTTPVMNGTAAIGSGTTWARADHVHPTDTSRAPLASPAFTGTPTAPTATVGTSTTQLATTAFVEAALSNSTAVSAATTLTAAKAGVILVSATAAYTITMPSISAAKGLSYTFIRTDNSAFTVTIARASTTEQFVGDIATATSASLPASTQYGLMHLVSDGTNWNVTSTNLSPNLLGTPTISGTAIATTASTVNNANNLGGTAATSYALLASPTFTGVPSAPTASAGTNTTQLATTAFVATSFAPLASPTFTGTPAAPTAAVDTNTTQLATTAYVVGQGYLKSATASSTYAPLASPALTGTPTAPTVATSDNSTSLATTAWVKAQGYGGLTYVSTEPVSGSYTKPTTLFYNNTEAGGYVGLTLVTSGTANKTAWAASTVYNVGAVVNANGYVYQCTVAGTSGSTAPSFTSGTGTDGTVTWQFVDYLAVFKPFGLIST